MTNKTLKEEIEHWLLAEKGVRHTMKFVPESQRELFAHEMSNHIATYLQSRLDSIEWPMKLQATGPYGKILPQDEAKAKGHNEALEACQQAVNKAFGVE